MLLTTMMMTPVLAILSAADPGEVEREVQRERERHGRVQLQLDLFDVSSPGAGLWVNYVRLRPNDRPSWQIGVSAGAFNHYERGELRTHGWGHAEDLRVYGRVAASVFLWRGLFLGGQVEVMTRILRQRETEELRSQVFPTLQPAFGYNWQPWGWDRGTVGLMPWVGPRFILIRRAERFDDGEVIDAPPLFEFASGLNISVNF